MGMKIFDSPHVISMTTFIVLFGATSDVSKRYIFPSLAHLGKEQILPTDCTIVGVGRKDWTTPQFQEHVSEILGRFGPSLPSELRENFLFRLAYVQVEDLSNASAVENIFTARGSSAKSASWLLYLGLPPNLFPTIVKSLNQINIPSNTRLIVEKPFGLNLDQAKMLNNLLHDQFPERFVFRMDHFLGKAVVFSILGLRLESCVFGPLWSNRFIRKVEIIWDETLSLEGRAKYYDSAGALKDMIQSHLLQILAVLAMEPVKSVLSPEFRESRVQLFRAVRKMTKKDIQAHTTRARYLSGRVAGKQVRTYAQESGVDPQRKTETFAQATFWVDNDRWSGVPFIVRSGKALHEDQMEAAVYFQNREGTDLSPASHEDHDVLHINLKTDGLMSLDVHSIGGKNEDRSNAIEIQRHESSQTIPPYSRLFQEALNGNQSLFIRNDEVEEMWKIVHPILNVWANNEVPLRSYRAGSSGPAEQRR